MKRSLVSVTCRRKSGLQGHTCFSRDADSSLGFEVPILEPRDLPALFLYLRLMKSVFWSDIKKRQISILLKKRSKR